MDDVASRTLLDEFLDAWRYTRAGVIAEVANLPAARLAERPAGVQRTALELVEHIVASGRLMAGELSRADGDFLRAPYSELLAEHARQDDRASSQAAALELLRRSLDEDAGRLQRAGSELLMRPIRQFNGEYATRLVWLHHGVAHEEYHRGQLALQARLLGVVPALTQEIAGE